MYSLNNVELIGSLGKTPGLRYSENDNVVTAFCVSTVEKNRSKKGKLHEKTHWHNVVAFNDAAHFCANYLKKGTLIYVGGKLKTRSYTDKYGIKHQFTEIVAKELRVLVKKSERQTSKSSRPN